VIRRLRRLLLSILAALVLRIGADRN